MKAIMHRMHAEAFKALLRHLRLYLNLHPHTNTYIHAYTHIYICGVRSDAENAREAFSKNEHTRAHIYVAIYIYICGSQ